MPREVADKSQSFTRMSDKTVIPTDCPTVIPNTDDAVGVPDDKKWFVAIVTCRHEKKSAESLSKLQIENYVPVQALIRENANGRKRKVDHVVIPCVVFVHCTETERRQIVTLPFVNRFMTNKSGTSVNGITKPIAVVSDKEIEQLKFMLGQSDVPIAFTETRFNLGQKVRVIRGGLNGLEGKVIELHPGKSELIVALDLFGCARLSIDTVNLELVKE